MAKPSAKNRSEPDQQDVDSLAALLEAAEELRREPFFGSDNKSNGRQLGEATPARSGDRFHFRSALICFRRIWLKQEASNFFWICKLLEEFEGGGLGISAIQVQHKEYTERRWKNFPLTSEQVVDLWLKAVFVQISLKGSALSRWRERIDLGRLVKEHDPDFLESVCRTTVSAVGTCYFQLLEVARPTLARWERDYKLRPEFEMGVLGDRSHAEGASTGKPSPRAPLTDHSGDETRQQRFERILSRDSFKGLKAVLDSLHKDRAIICEEVNGTNSYQELLTRLGYSVVLTKQIHVNDCYSRVGPSGGIKTVLSHHDMSTHSTLATLVNLDSTVTTTPKSIDFFNSRLAELKTQLMN